MYQAALFVALALTVTHSYGFSQVQMPETAELLQPDEDLQAQVKELQKNVTDLWNYIFQLRSAVSHHLTHLRQHQMELESSMHKMEHFHESDSQSSGHHHSDDHHSHSGEHHSHSGDHSHSSDHSHSGEHSHGDEHSHGSMESHSHSGEQHSHSGEQHSHNGDHGHYSHSYSHSHTSHDHSKEDSHNHGSHDDHSHSHGSHDDHHSHGQEHKDSHETEDLTQQTQKAGDPVSEPIVTSTDRQEHYHHHHHHQSSSDSLNLLNENIYHHHDHHDHQHDSRRRNRTVVLPRYSDYGLYDLATCRVQPNSATPEDQRQNVFGTITFWQKKTGGPLNMHLRLQGFEMGDHHGHHQQSVQQEEDNETPQSMSHKHGFHVHAFGDLSNGCQSAGPHYNPKGVNHGAQDALVRHVGDLGNIECDEHGNTNLVLSDDVASLKGQYSILGKAIVIHEKDDDLGLGGDAESLKTGNAGSRLACCVIQQVDKIPIRQYKIMKTATQFRKQ